MAFLRGNGETRTSNTSIRLLRNLIASSADLSQKLKNKRADCSTLHKICIWLKTRLASQITLFPDSIFRNEFHLVWCIGSFRNSSPNAAESIALFFISSVCGNMSSALSVCENISISCYLRFESTNWNFINSRIRYPLPCKPLETPHKESLFVHWIQF